MGSPHFLPLTKTESCREASTDLEKLSTQRKKKRNFVQSIKKRAWSERNDRLEKTLPADWKRKSCKNKAWIEAAIKNWEKETVQGREDCA